MDNKTKFLLTSALFLVVLGAVFVAGNLSLGKLRIVGCDVGQGDAILVISPGGKQVLIDGGPGTKVIDCLSQKMPFWDKTIEMVVLTHPERDHLEGLLEVLARYKVDLIVTSGETNDTELYKVWKEAEAKSGAKIRVVKASDKINVDKLGIDVLWPPAAEASEGKPQGGSDVNDSSLAMRVNFGSFCAYLTGDLPKEIFKQIASQGLALRGCQVLKVSHHGSKTGTSEEVVNLAKPQIALFEVGKNNYGHPDSGVLDLFSQKGVKVLRTDKDGDVEIDSDGKSFGVKN